MSRKKGKASRHRRENAGQDLVKVIRTLAGGEFPPEEERWKIIERRQLLMREMLRDMLTHDGQNQIARAHSFLNKYDQRDILMVLNAMQQNLPRSVALLDTARTYRGYRRAFARYGDDRRFLSSEEFEELNVEYIKLSMKREMLPVIKLPPGKREKELRHLVLAGNPLWEDIMPPAVPSRPVEFEVQKPGEYASPIQILLTWGWDIDGHRIDRTVHAERKRWLASVSDLQRMVLDEGLLDGWPGEAASWAPEQALEVLGFLKVGEGMAALAKLAERPDDWLSDKLPMIWASAEPSIENELGEDFANPAYSTSRRNALLSGLHIIAINRQNRREAVIQLLVKVLMESPSEHATLNGYIVRVLDDLKAEEAKNAILEAFEGGRVDEKIIQHDDIDWI